MCGHRSRHMPWTKLVEDRHRLENPALIKKKKKKTGKHKHIWNQRWKRHLDARQPQAQESNYSRIDSSLGALYVADYEDLMSACSCLTNDKPDQYKQLIFCPPHPAHARLIQRERFPVSQVQWTNSPHRESRPNKSFSTTATLIRWPLPCEWNTFSCNF